MRTSFNRIITLGRINLFFLILILLQGCATTYRYYYKPNPSFTEENVGKLHVGMTPSEVESVFGKPNEEYTTEFGEKTSKKWTGKVWVYFTEKDDNLKYAKRYKKNTLVFHQSDRALKLNHWDIEE